MSNKAHRTPVFVNNAANLSALSTSLACFSVGIERHAKEVTQFVDGAGKKNGGKGPSSLSVIETRRHRDRAKSFLEEQQVRVNEVEQQLIQQTDEALNFTRLNECEPGADPPSLSALAELCRIMHIANAHKIYRLESRLTEYGYRPTEQNPDLLPAIGFQQSIEEEPTHLPVSGIVDDDLNPMGVGLPLDQVDEVDYETDSTPMTHGKHRWSQSDIPTAGTPVTPTLASLHLSKSTENVLGYRLDFDDAAPDQNGIVEDERQKLDNGLQLRDEQDDPAYSPEPSNEGSSQRRSIDSKSVEWDATERSTHEAVSMKGTENKASDVYGGSSKWSEYPSVDEKEESSHVTDVNECMESHQNIVENESLASSDQIQGPVANYFKVDTFTEKHSTDLIQSQVSKEETSYDSDYTYTDSENEDDMNDTYDLGSVATVTTVVGERKLKMLQVSSIEQEIVEKPKESQHPQEFDTNKYVNRVLLMDASDLVDNMTRSSTPSLGGDVNDSEQKSYSQTQMSLASYKSVDRKAVAWKDMHSSPTAKVLEDVYDHDDSDDEIMLVTPVLDRYRMQPGSNGKLTRVVPVEATRHGKILSPHQNSVTSDTTSSDHDQYPQSATQQPILPQIVNSHKMQIRQKILRWKENDERERGNLSDDVSRKSSHSPENKGTPVQRFNPGHTIFDATSAQKTPISFSLHQNGGRKVFPKTPIIKFCHENNLDEDETVSTVPSDTDSLRHLPSPDSKAAFFESMTVHNRSRSHPLSPSVSPSYQNENGGSNNRSTDEECGSSRSGNRSISSATSPPSLTGTQQRLFDPQSPILSRTPLAAAWMAKKLSEAKERDEAKESDLFSSSKQLDFKFQEQTTEESVGIKLLKQHEYDAAPKVVKMQVSLVEVNNAAIILNGWFATAEEERETGNLQIMEEDAYGLLAAHFNMRKSKSLLMSLCHWRRMVMQKSSVVGESKCFVLAKP